jgi:hypothetical protein
MDESNNDFRLSMCEGAKLSVSAFVDPIGVKAAEFTFVPAGMIELFYFVV